ncbi:MAG TPA: S41 family peptidase [Steroidobacteraceae bacterium]|nr:S41 family peptidase [Steroidobacteraceae bacterium]
MEFLRVKESVCVRALIASSVMLCLAGCGGGGDDSGGTPGPTAPPAPNWVQGSYPNSSTFAGKCAAPRSGINPATGSAFTDTQGSVTHENFWIRSWTHEYYLWYREVLDRSPAAYGTTAAYFDTQKTTATTTSGKFKDEFHFTSPTRAWVERSQAGIEVGYGVEWAFISTFPPRILKVAYTEPNSPASNAGLPRGARVTFIDNVSIDVNTNAGIDILNAALAPDVGATHSFTIVEVNGAQRSVTLTAAAVTTAPVQNVRTITTTSGPVGYMLFNSHLATSEQQLINAFTQLKQDNVTDLVLDLRYNGGGYLSIASEVAYMIAGAGPTTGRVFEHTVFNDQYPSALNPVTGGSNTPTPFHSTSRGFLGGGGALLPTLNLSRVFVLTGPGTCSASESVINGLRGVNVAVIQIGNTTCGKPYGFYDEDNCGTTYFSIQLQGVNDAGFGSYADGFSPTFRSNGVGVQVPGCTVADDLDHALGDSSENRLAAALYYRANGACSASISVGNPSQLKSDATSDGETLERPRRPWRENRILDTVR